jgi:hypothetical protein
VNPKPNQEDKLPLDYYMNVIISDDRMTAKLQILHEDAEFNCTIEELEQFLQQNGVKFGLRMDTLAQIAREPRKFIFNQVTVASGILPVDGEDGYIRYHFDMQSEKRPLELEGGRVDFKEVTSLNNIKKGQLIAERIPAGAGQDGRGVTGETIPAKKGKEARLKPGKNVVIDPEQRRMYAAIDGLITITERDRINVFPVYEVNGDVDYSVGNIDFVGNVIIRGNVLAGFKVRAAGDIRIIGGVEAAEVVSDGSIEISAGIMGSGKGLVKAAKNVKCSFIQEGNVEAGENVLVTQSIMHSTVRAGRKVECMGAKGLIVGGLIQAGEHIRARVIGNTTSTATTLEVGVLPELRNEMADLRNRLKDMTANADKTEKALRLLDQLAATGQLTPDKADIRSRLSVTRNQLNQEMAEIRERILEIEKSLEDISNAKVEVVNTIYGGCKIVIGRYTRFVKDATTRVTFRMVDGEISMVSAV